jgi:hypothetical protein
LKEGEIDPIVVITAKFTFLLVSIFLGGGCCIDAVTQLFEQPVKNLITAKRNIAATVMRGCSVYF